MVLPGDPVIATATALAVWLSDAITAGKYGPGDLLPSERDLSERFGVGRTLVRKAMLEVRAAGLVELTRGDGWAVRWPDEDRETVRIQRGSKVVIRAATPRERWELDLPEGTAMAEVTLGGQTRVFRGDRCEFTTA